MTVFDVEKLREDFPILQKKINGKPIVYFDNACMSLRPRQVVEAIEDYYYNYPACGSRSVHKLGRMATEKYHESRQTISKFIGAKKDEELIFTRNTTEGINLVANSLGLKKGDVVLITDKEHNSNLLPWQILAERVGITYRVVHFSGDMTFSMENFEKSMDRSVKLVSMAHTSNLDGYTIPAGDLIKAAHDFGSLVMLDAAQSVPHKEVDVRKLDVDFLAFSGHKMLGPSGTGALYVKSSLQDRLSPFIVGGDTVKNTTLTSYELEKPPEKFEAGLQDYAGAIGFAAAARYLERVGRKDIEKHESKLNMHLTSEMSQFEGLRIIGPSHPELRGGIISFTVEGIDPHTIAMILDENANVMVRSGQHCVHSWFNEFGIPGSVRLSFYLYNTMDEAHIFFDELKRIITGLR